MKIQNLPIFNTKKTDNYVTTPKVESSNYSVNFGNKADAFIKSADSTFEIARKLKSRFKTLLEEAQVPQHFTDHAEAIRVGQRKNDDIAQIHEEYMIVKAALDIALQKDAPEIARRVEAWIEATRTLGKNKGFNRIYGYRDIKNKLINEFALGKMMMATISDDVKVPNALIVYGLPNNGKTLFAHALGEASLSPVNEVSLAKLGSEARAKKISRERLAMDEILKYAKAAKANYKNNNRQRTIILVNEAEHLTKSGSPVFKEFKKFITTCSEEYKCTLFLTTNYPQTFDKALLNPKITPLKIGVEPANRENCREIIEGMLKPLGKFPDDGIDVLVEDFFKDPNNYYSNASIVDVISTTLNHFGDKKPLIRDYEEIISQGDIKPTIEKKELDEFYATKKALEE